MGIAAALRRAQAFADLDPQSLAALTVNARGVRIGRGEILFREGDTAERLYILIIGKMKVGKAIGAGRQLLLTILGPGDMFGEMSLVDPGPRMATATAVSEVGLVCLDHDFVRTWLAGHPQVAEALAQQAVRWLRVGAEAMTDLVLRDVPGRVAKMLLDLAARFGTAACGGGVYLDHGLTQDELAQLAGTSRETLNKTLAEFAGRGWIRPKCRALIIVDVARMRRRATVGGRSPTDAWTVDQLFRAGRAGWTAPLV